MHQSVSKKKAEIRKKFLEIRNGISQEDYLQKSKAISENTVQWIDSLNVNHVHCYLSIDSRNEVKTDNIIEWLIRNHFTVSVPVVDFRNDTLEHYQITTNGSFEENKWGVREPDIHSRRRRTEPALFDIVIVPVVASDNEKNRLGYGKGFYDRFLAKTPAIKAGLVFDCCISNKTLPVEPFDINLDLIISESGVQK